MVSSSSKTSSGSPEKVSRLRISWFLFLLLWLVLWTTTNNIINLSLSHINKYLSLNSLLRKLAPYNPKKKSNRDLFFCNFEIDFCTNIVLMHWPNSLSQDTLFMLSECVRIMFNVYRANSLSINEWYNEAYWCFRIW